MTDQSRHSLIANQAGSGPITDQKGAALITSQVGSGPITGHTEAGPITDLAGAALITNLVVPVPGPQQTGGALTTNQVGSEPSPQQTGPALTTNELRFGPTSEQTGADLIRGLSAERTSTGCPALAAVRHWVLCTWEQAAVRHWVLYTGEQAAVRHWVLYTGEQAAVRHRVLCTCEQAAVRHWVLYTGEQAAVRHRVLCTCEQAAVRHWVLYTGEQAEVRHRVLALVSRQQSLTFTPEVLRVGMALPGEPDTCCGGLLALLLLLLAQALRSELLQPYDLLYEQGVDAYYSGDFRQVVQSMEQALSSHAELRATRLRCRRGCRREHPFSEEHQQLWDLAFFRSVLGRAACVRHCEEATLGPVSRHRVSEEVQHEFYRRIPYNFLQRAYYKVRTVHACALFVQQGA
ncbi:hypothetical protein NDU88_000239 [Pleurodeles waltl]|uniref:Leprecan-like alpha-helical domain-containing protein n=1 Tax=Pleurodeles waltl TaxID=8319 RepID=A0AAV7L960_PLEWA|nr:hypothetical protein NDU88_000239 [Pleurodeles waltl]